MRTIRTLVLCLAMGLSAAGAPPALLPQPRSVQWRAEGFAAAAYRLTASNDAAREAVVRELGAPDPAAAAEVALVHEAGLREEAYTLDVQPGRIRIGGSTTRGQLWGVMTLRQLAARSDAGIRVPGCRIEDAPAFAWRGFMHDVGRNPQDVEMLKRFLDVMGRYKMNVFHFHLTDHPGYRVECRVHPELNDPRFQTRRPGFFYTYAQVNDLIAYARDRGILVVPEVDLPGHSDYFQRAFGTDMQSERGMAILEAVLNEFMDHVSSPYVHIGSDEVRLRNPGFLDHFADLVRGRGRTVLVWRPGGLPKGRVVTQLWSAGAKPNGMLPGLPALDSRHNYINHMDPFDGWLRVLNLATCNRATGDDLAWGGIVCHWPDVYAGDPRNVYRQSPVMPALLASAERYWRGHTPERPDLWAKLPAPDDPRFAEMEDFERRLLARRDADFGDWPFPCVRQTHIPWKLIGPADWSKAAITPEQEIRDAYAVGGATCRWVRARGATIHINHFWYDGWLPKAAGGTAYAVSYVWSPRPQSVDFWIGFNGPSRSDRRKANPPAGKWSSSDARIWIAGREIPPPEWRQPGLGPADNEKPFVDEDYFYRPPVPVALEAGWNKILVKAPKTAADWKWMFTCVPVRVDGDKVREVEGLRHADSMPSS